MSVFYRGRLDAAPAAPATVLDEWGVLPADLLPRMADAKALVVADPVSFPFESLRPGDWDTPMLVSLLGLGVDDLDALGPPILSQLVPGDGVVAGRKAWEQTSVTFRWDQVLWLGDDLAPATSRFLVQADRTAKGRLRALTAAVRLHLQRFHPATAWEADGWSTPVRSALPSYIRWVTTGPAEVVLAHGVPADDSRVGVLWDAVAPDGVLVLHADVVTTPGGPQHPTAREVCDHILGAGPAGARLDDVRSVVDPATPRRTAAVFAFTRGRE